MVQSRTRGVLTRSAGSAFAVGLFVLASVLPCSAAQAPEPDPVLRIKSGGCGTVKVGTYAEYACFILVQPVTQPADTQVGLLADLTAVGGRPNVGAPRCIGCGLGPWAFEIVDLRVPAGLTPGRKIIPLTIYDNYGRTGRGSVTIMVVGRPADYDRDGVPDVVTYAPATGVWKVKGSSSSFTSQWGLGPDDVPVQGDYDGDGVLDLAVYRPSNGTWYVCARGFGGCTGLQWGTATDIPVPRDYNGDGRTDLAVWRPQTGQWFIYFLDSGTFVAYQWGMSGDVPVPDDYDGDGRLDLAVWRPSNGSWYVFFSSTRTFAELQWGLGTDVPVPGDYDADGRADLAVWRPSSGVWWIWNLARGTSAAYQWGMEGDQPVPGDYDGDGRPELAVWRVPPHGEGVTAYWIVYNRTSGSAVWHTIDLGDIPLAPPRAFWRH
jgi:hypothetical protein